MPAISYVDTGGNSGYSGSRDSNTPVASGSAASYAAGIVTLDGSPDLSGLNTSGLNQDSIYLSTATNANKKRFFITAFNNTTKTVTLDITAGAVTGVTSSGWVIGGRMTLAGLTGGESYLRAGDQVIINNSPASVAGACITVRTAGDASSGYCRFKGKAGVRPALTCTDNSASTITGNVAYVWLENLEVVNSGTSGHAINLSGSSADYWIVFNTKVSDAGGDGVHQTSGAGNLRVVFCDISGCGGDGVWTTDNSAALIYNYIHDLTGNGISTDVAGDEDFLLIGNIIDTCGGRGFLKTSGQRKFITAINNTIYGCNNSGFETAFCFLVMFNNIMKDNGDAGGEYNFESSSDQDLHALAGYNCFSIAGSRGGANLSNYTARTGDITSDPVFTNAGSGDFSLGSGSPAIGTGKPGVPGLLT